MLILARGSLVSVSVRAHHQSAAVVAVLRALHQHSPEYISAANLVGCRGVEALRGLVLGKQQQQQTQWAAC